MGLFLPHFVPAHTDRARSIAAGRHADCAQCNLFAYALGDGTDFDTIYFPDTLSTDTSAIERAWLLHPTQLQPQPQPQSPGQSTYPPTLPSKLQPTGFSLVARYHRFTITRHVDWQYWYDFYYAVIKSLLQAGAEVELDLTIAGMGDVNTNLVDLNVVQYNSQGKVDIEGQQRI